MSLDLLESEVWTGSQDWTQDLVGGVQTWESKLGSLEFRLGVLAFSVDLEVWTWHVECGLEVWSLDLGVCCIDLEFRFILELRVCRLDLEFRLKV